MKILDLNVLLYATDTTAARHPVARPWLDRVLSSAETVGLPTAVTVGYVRITTNPRVMASPLDVRTATDVVKGWLARPNVTVPVPTARHYDVMAELLAPLGAGGNLVADAHLAALAREHGAELCSFDRDLGRFAGVRWVEPA